MNSHYKQLLDKLKEVFPDKLPLARDYSPEKMMMLIGQQEVIRFLERYITEDSN